MRGHARCRRRHVGGCATRGLSGASGVRVDGSAAVCQTDAIRTTLDIDDDLMRTLLDRLPGRSKTDAIEYAIEAFLAGDAVDRLRGLAGTLEIEDLSQELRALDRTT